MTREEIKKEIEQVLFNIDVNEIRMAIEHSTTYAAEIIQKLTKTILDLQQELSIANDKLKKIEKIIKGE